MKRPRESATFAQYGWKETPFESHERSWSPDGSKVASWSRPGQFGEKTDYLLSVANVDGMVQEVLLNNVPWGEWVAFSKDGKKLAFGAVLDRGVVSSYPFHLLSASKLLSLFVMDLQTKKLQELVRGNVSPLNYSDQIWSPDSTAILYQTRDHEIYIYDFVTGTSPLLTKGEHATWSPQGNQIAFRSADRNYYLVKPDGTGRALLLRNGPFREVYGPLIWSPTGQY
jgi:Tol biopolymer transport system component